MSLCPKARLSLVLAFVGLVAAGAQSALFAQAAPAPTAPAIEKLGPGLLRIGPIRVDLGKRELSIPARINDVMVLEFVANTRDGMKAYESALTIDSDAITFNAALLLIGLDKSHARVPTRHFDPVPPDGDKVELSIEWKAGDNTKRVAVEELLFDREFNKPVPPSAWVYTGSGFLQDGRYLADADGVLIGFVHSPAPVIENVGGAGVNRYGAVILNPNLGLAPLTPVTLTIRAVGAR
jgi:hypothetical protein